MRKMRLHLVLMAMAAAIICGCRDKTPPGAKRELDILCGAGIRPAMEPIKAAFEKANNCTVRVNYAGSGTHMGSLQVGVEADLWLPGDIWWVHKAQEKGLVDNYRVVAWFVPVIAVQKGNPKGIKKLKDFAREGLEIGVGKPEACAIGNVTLNVFAAAGVKGKVKATFEALTVNRLANQVKIRALDATIIWDAVAKQYPEDIEIVPIEDGNFHAVALAMGVLKQSKNKPLAEKFAEFAASDAGAKYFRDNHYQVPGRKLRVGCGSSMRPPAEDLAKLFQEQTGCKVLCDYGGSGIVLNHIQETKEGDVYICHDPFAYMCDDRKISARWHAIAYLHPILAVQKGNPKNVKGLKDLLRDDLEIGLSHRKYSTRGKILWMMLEKAGMAEAMKKRKFFEERTHTLVNQLKLGAVDVATLWDAPARAMAEIDVVPIEKEYEVDAITSATSKRTFSLKHVKVTVVRLNFSKEPLLAAQFAKMCLSDAGRKILIKHCFMLPQKR